MDERDLQLLVVLANTKNITKAADKLYLTQSALSKRIAAIERELNISLLLRSRQGVHFTAEGETVLRYAENIRQQFEQMRNSIKHHQGAVTGTLNAGISINYAAYHLPAILAAYRRACPQVNANIKTDYNRHLFLQLLDGSLDVAIIRGDFPWKDKRILLQTEKICVICHPQDKNKPLSEIPYIRRKSDTVFQRELTQWLKEQNISVKPEGICVDNISICVEMVKRGLGWTVVPEIALADFHGEIRPLFFLNGEPLERSTYLMYNETALALPQVKAFIDVVIKENNHV